MGAASHEQYVNNEQDHVSNGFSQITSVRLLTSTAGLTDESVLADFDALQATFSGYLAVNPADVRSPNGDQDAWLYDHSEAVFTHNGGATSNNIVGWYAVGYAIDRTAPISASSYETTTEVMMYETFASISMSSMGDEIRVKIQQNYQGVD